MKRPLLGHSASDRYHDRVARMYDAMYEGDAYWRFYREITWENMKRYLPREAGAQVLDAGGGTGYWALRLARSGFRVTLADTSRGMLEAARRALERAAPPQPVELVQADIADLKPFSAASFDFVLAQGDPLSFCDSAERGARAIHRVLRPGAVGLISVDGQYGGLDPVLEKEGIEGLDAFLRSGRTKWLARETVEQFPIRTFTPDQLRRLFTRAGCQILSLIGKTVLPARRVREKLNDREFYVKLLKLERRLHSEEAMLGRAAHLEIAVKRPSDS